MIFHDFPMFPGKSGKYEIHPPKLCASILGHVAEWKGRAAFAGGGFQRAAPERGRGGAGEAAGRPAQRFGDSAREPRARRVLLTLYSVKKCIIDTI